MKKDDSSGQRNKLVIEDTTLELELLTKLILKPCGMQLNNIEVDKESREYAAHRIQIGKFKAIFRVSKITPIKSGQFVTVWKRNIQGITKPFDLSDGIDFYIIGSKKENHLGFFIFPKKILQIQRIISDANKVGKLGIRVYPPWDTTTSKQAQKTQNWQSEYFVDASNEKKIDINQVSAIFGLE
ncbi:MepB family protein [Leptospira sp. GIMC2001]|uniref:MepB family protein n=1 Tax=Leptospira sp. GIMC2001 TaxID=1513297 RepID=UPI0023491094|nr:MepB family protein [Leptospira sp. GIMC2001]WCL50309.1 MepB family protein [Leptospira sp. GIMC2001]